MTTVNQSGVWRDAPSFQTLMAEPENYYVFGGPNGFEDFNAPCLDAYTTTQATTGTLAAGNSTLVIDSGSTTQGQGANVQLDAAPFLAATAKRIWFEARVKVADLPADVQTFIGLSEVDTTLIASNALDTTNSDLIGFYADGTTQAANAGALYFVVAEGGTAEDVDAVTTLTDDTYVNVGFTKDTSGVCTYYINGVAGSSTLETYEPAGDLTLSLVCQSDGTSDPILHVDWVRIIVER